MDGIPDDELEAVRRGLAELGEAELPPAVAQRLDARLAAELSSSPLSRQRSRRRLRLGAGLSSAAAVAAAVIVALSSGGHHPATESSALPPASTSAADRSSLKATSAFKAKAPNCGPPSRRAGGRPQAGCPGARGGHARAV